MRMGTAKSSRPDTTSGSCPDVTPSVTRLSASAVSGARPARTTPSTDDMTTPYGSLRKATVKTAFAPPIRSRHASRHGRGRSGTECVLVLFVDVLFADVPVDITRRLQREHVRVRAAERHELVVRAPLHDLAVVDHHDVVGSAHRREPVRDHDR